MRWAYLCMYSKAGLVSFLSDQRPIMISFIYIQVEFQTASGQMIDLITTLEGEKDLSKYSLPL
jgi:hypothetical protein